MTEKKVSDKRYQGKSELYKYVYHYLIEGKHYYQARRGKDAMMFRDEREAGKQADKFLIKAGLPPVNILKPL